METAVFLISAAIVLAGGLGVIISRSPVHAALSLVATLFGVAVLFVAQEAHFLAAVQVIVYTGAIVVLILFVLMLLGVDRVEDTSIEPLVGQRFLAVLVGLAVVVIVGSVLLIPVLDDPVDGSDASVESLVVTGQRTATEPAQRADVEVSPTDEEADVAADDSDIARMGRILFTDYALAFEITAALLTIAVVGAVLLSRRPSGYEPLPPEPVVDDGSEDDEGADSDGADEAEVTS
jgi:NADH-quinone oxidoreductase subunit J